MTVGAGSAGRGAAGAVFCFSVNWPDAARGCCTSKALIRTMCAASVQRRPGAVHVVLMSEPRDPYCQRTASQIGEVVDGASREDVTPAEYAREDGTFNEQTGEFACDACYIELGMPTSAAGWKAGQPVPQPAHA